MTVSINQKLSRTKTTALKLTGTACGPQSQIHTVQSPQSPHMLSIPHLFGTQTTRIEKKSAVAKFYVRWNQKMMPHE